MSSPTVIALSRFPLKGAAARKTNMLQIDTTVGVRHDRSFAIRRRPGMYTDWASKGNFHCCMNTPAMAIERPIFSSLDGLPIVDSVQLAGLRQRIGANGPLQNTRGLYSLADTRGAYVSFLNLATVRALSNIMCIDVDPRRFRMNVWMTGLEPFEELSWVDNYPGTKEFALGTVRFRVDDACERCKARITEGATAVGSANASCTSSGPAA